MCIFVLSNAFRVHPVSKWWAISQHRLYQKQTLPFGPSFQNLDTDLGSTETFSPYFRKETSILTHGIADCKSFGQRNRTFKEQFWRDRLASGNFLYKNVNGTDFTNKYLLGLKNSCFLKFVYIMCILWEHSVNIKQTILQLHLK